MKFLWLIIGCFIALTGWSEIYRCQDNQGRMAFWDRPCKKESHGHSEPYEVKSRIESLKFVPAVNGLSGANRNKKSVLSDKLKKSKYCRRFTSTELRNLRVKDKMAYGMPMANLEKRFGRNHTTESVGGQGEKWVYKTAHMQRTLTFKDKCLVAWKEKWLTKRSKISKYQD